MDYPDSRLFRDRVRESNGGGEDLKSWKLSSSGSFSVKSFYNFLVDGGLRCPVVGFFWRGTCPKKINLLNWLVWKNKVSSLDNLAKKRCNRLPTSTCVLYNAGIESVDHLFLSCQYLNIFGVSFRICFIFRIHLVRCVTYGSIGGTYCNRRLEPLATCL